MKCFTFLVSFEFLNNLIMDLGIISILLMSEAYIDVQENLPVLSQAQVPQVNLSKYL